MSATHDQKALVTLRVSLRDYAGSPTWQVEFDVRLEPGALHPIAEHIRGLVG
jgi:hypothetical protein